MATSRPTITDVARVAGVSKGAVSFALNGKPGVAADTRERTVAVARDLGWTPDLPQPEFVIRASTAPPRRPGARAPSKDRRRSAPIRHLKES